MDFPSRIQRYDTIIALFKCVYCFELVYQVSHVSHGFFVIPKTLGYNINLILMQKYEIDIHDKGEYTWHINII